MATPTAAEIRAQWGAAVLLLDEQRKYGRTNSKNVLDMLDALEQTLEGDYNDEVTAAGQAYRAAAASVLTPEFAQTIMRPFLKQYCKTVVGRTDLTNDVQMLQEVYLYNHTNSVYVQSRGITYGAPAAGGGNHGNGQIVRLSTDQYNYPIENIYTDSKKATCVADFQTGTNVGEETFQIQGGALSKDNLNRSGSGNQIVLAGISANSGLLANASWSSFTPDTTSPTDIQSWTSSAGVSSSICTFDTGSYFRYAPQDFGGTPYAINVKASTILSQKLSLQGTKLNPDVPYLMAVAWNAAVGSGVGTLELRFGNANRSITVNGQSGWNISLVPSTPGQSCWYKNIAQDDIGVQIQWTRTSGNLLIDDVLLAPGTPHDNTWYWALPASTATYAPWRVNDSYTWTDTAIESKIQRFLAWAWSAYMPSRLGSSINWTDPT